MAAALVSLPALVGASVMDTGTRTVQAANGRASYDNFERLLPGSASTRGRLLQLTLDDPIRGRLPMDLGTITTEAARGGSMVSEMYIEGFKAGDQAVPTVAYHASGPSAPSQAGVNLTLSLNSQLLASQMKIAKWRTSTSKAQGALASLDAASGAITVPGFDFAAHLGDRGWLSEVTAQRAVSRWAVTLDDLSVRLGNLLPVDLLPLGTSLALVTSLDLPLGDTLAASVAATTRLVATLADVQSVLNEIDALRGDLLDAAVNHPALQAALAALDAAEAALVNAANAVTASLANFDAAQVAQQSAAAAAASASAAVQAAQSDVNNAAATVALAQQSINSIDAEIAALNAELATASPTRLLEIPGEIAARQTARTAAVANLSSAQNAHASAQLALQSAQSTLDTRQGAVTQAQAAVNAAQADVNAKLAAVTNAEASVVAAEATLAATQGVNSAVTTMPARQAALRDRLAALLQGVSDILATLPPLPVLEQELDQVLRATPILKVDGLALESFVEATPTGGANKVHCTVEAMSVLGYTPDLEQCSDLIDASKHAVEQINELLRNLGAIGVEGVTVKGPHGIWNDPKPNVAGFIRSEGKMSALTLKVPSVRLSGVPANALALVAPVLEMIQSRQATRIMLPTISPKAGQTDMKMAAGSGERMSIMAASGPTLGSQLSQVNDELNKLESPQELENLSTGGIDLVVAEAETVVDFRAAGRDDDVDPLDWCDGDMACILACMAGDCPAGSLVGGSRGAGDGKGVGSGADGHGGLGGITPDGKLPMTGGAGGLAAVALLAAGATGLRGVRRGRKLHNQ